jgi:hypothetical protein
VKELDEKGYSPDKINNELSKKEIIINSVESVGYREFRYFGKGQKMLVFRFKPQLAILNWTPIKENKLLEIAKKYRLAPRREYGFYGELVQGDMFVASVYPTSKFFEINTQYERASELFEDLIEFFEYFTTEKIGNL